MSVFIASAAREQRLLVAGEILAPCRRAGIAALVHMATLTGEIALASPR